VTKLYAGALLIKDFRIAVDDGRSHSVCLDLPTGTGSDMGPTALELCLMSYAGCYATIFRLTAKKMRIRISELEIRLEAVEPEEAETITETSLNITVNADALADRVERIHKLTLQNCPVGKLFEKAGVKINYVLTIKK
jgi:putative redox protein